MRFKLMLTVLMACLVFVGFSPVQADAGKLVIRLSHSNQPDSTHPFHNSAVKIKEKLEKRLGKDRVEVQIYPAGQLGGEERGVQDLQQGIIHLTILSINNASIFATSMMAFDLPYIFQSQDEFWKCIKENRNLFNEYLEKESNTYAVLWMAMGYRDIMNSKHPIRSLKDLQNLKIRVPNNPLMVESFRSWGNQPVPIAWDETFNALQQKVVDGVENPIVALTNRRFYEMCKYLTGIKWKLTICPILTSASWLKSLPEDVRTALLEVCLEAEKELIDEYEGTNARCRQIMLDNGVKISGSPVDEDEWMRRSMALWPKFYPAMKSPAVLNAIMKSVGRELPR